MELGLHFKRNDHKASPYYSGAGIEDRFLECLREEVLNRLERPSTWRLSVTSMRSQGNEDLSAAPPPNFICPDCPYPATEPDFWKEHLLELHQHHTSHWHQCLADRWCAMVPVVYGNFCLALFNMACPSSVDEAELVRKVEMLEILVEHFLQRYDDLVEQLAKQNGRGVILA
jgi:hypothetical protein